MSEQTQPSRGSYHVLLREFDWANAPEGSDPHYWTIGDVTLNGRSVAADLRSISPYPPSWSWDTTLGFISWARTQGEALAYAEKLIQLHRSHYFVLTP